MKTQPNILFLFCDQLRADALGCYGHPFSITPAIDQLAREGKLYNRAYSPSPVCVPARMALTTGREPQDTGVFDNGNPCEDVYPTFMQHLTDAGYRTHGVGKMHFEPELYDLKGFQSREVGEEFGDRTKDDYMAYLEKQGLGHVLRPHGQRDTLYYIPQLSPVPAEHHPTYWAADRSIDFLKEHSQAESPFFLWTSFVHPHPPFTPPDPWHLLYPPALMPDPNVPNHSDELMTVHQKQQNRYKGADGGNNRRLTQAQTAYYHSCVSFIDYNIQRIIKELKAQGVYDNTLIVFSADHGELLGDYGCYGKRSFLQPSVRVPLIIKGEGIEVGTASSQPVDLLDISSTLLKAAGAKALPGSPGIDLTENQNRDVLYGQFSSGDLGLYHVVKDVWRYVFSAADKKEFLFCSDWDPSESMNLAYQSEIQEQVKGMRLLATAHFTDLKGRDLETEACNGPTQLGGVKPTRKRMDALDKSRDQGLLTSGDPVVADPDVRAYFDQVQFAHEGEGIW